MKLADFDFRIHSNAKTKEETMQVAIMMSVFAIAHFYTAMRLYLD